MEIEKLVESLSPIERKILPFLTEKSIGRIAKKSVLDKTSVLRALQFLSNKNIIKLKTEKRKIIELGINGILYLKTGLPERRLLNFIGEKPVSLEEAKKQSKLSENEFKAALGVLKKKAFIEIKEDKIILIARKEEATRKSLEEQFLQELPLDKTSLKPEQEYAFKNLENRKKIIQVREKQDISFDITELGKKVMEADLSELGKLIEKLTPEMIQSESWKNKKFRKYDIKTRVPEIFGGKRHFVNQAIEKARKIWTELGFKEMTGNFTVTGFWNFDALFTAQDHPVREMQDTLFLPREGKLPDKNIVNAVKEAHEKGVAGSKGWQYKWQEKVARKILLRTHTTVLSAKTLASLKNIKNKKGKFFAIGRCFRNETLDALHLFEFNQTEGIVIDKDANFRHLIGYLKEFARKMGYNKVRFRPGYFPYTEPSLEGDIYDSVRKQWLEVFAAGIFRPEVTEPLIGEWIPVLAWGPGFDRMISLTYKIKDLRELYKNNLNQLRKIKWQM